MANVETERIPYEGTKKVIGVALDDGPFLYQYEDVVQVDDGTPFTIEFFPDDHEAREYDVLGNGEITVITADKLQRWFDEGRAEIVSRE